MYEIYIKYEKVMCMLAQKVNVFTSLLPMCANDLYVQFYHLSCEREK